MLFFCEGLDTTHHRLLECPAPEAMRRRATLSGALRRRLELVGQVDPLSQRAWALAALGPHPYQNLEQVGLAPPTHRNFYVCTRRGEVVDDITFEASRGPIHTDGSAAAFGFEVASAVVAVVQVGHGSATLKALVGVVPTVFA